MEKIQTSRKTMRAVDEKLVFNKCWPKLAVDEAFTSVRVQDVFSLYLVSLPEDVHYDWVMNTNRFLLLGNFSLCYKFFVVMLTTWM